MPTIVKMACARIVDWDSFHDVFCEALGFPDFYGRNMNAWIDCMTYLDDPNSAMTTVHAPPGGVITIELIDVAEFIERCPEQYAALIECAAFVNWRRIEQNEEPVVAFSFHKQ
jgi:RNAse (barnase) inhibitor barstar